MESSRAGAAWGLELWSQRCGTRCARNGFGEQWSLELVGQIKLARLEARDRGGAMP